VFAILGLRALYFVLAGIIGTFRYLSKGLSVILCFIGVKMLISDLYHIPTGVSLAVVMAILAVAIVLSLRSPRAAGESPREGLADAAEAEITERQEAPRE